MAFSVRATEKVMAVNEDEELKKRGFMVGPTLGEGSYAKVKSAFSERQNAKVALKIINRRKAPKDFQQKFLPRELEVMKMIQHPNIIQLFEIMQFNGKVFIAMEIAGHGDLLEYIKLRGAVAEEKARAMFQQLANAVEYLHSVHVVHRDLKCENILLDCHNNVKVSDFGFSRLILSGELSRTFCGSAAYAAPEILQGIPYTGPSYDIWSMGVILYIMVCGSMPYDDSNIKKMIKYQTERKVGFSRSKKISPECKDLIYLMLESDVKQRATIPSIQNSSWLLRPFPPDDHHGHATPAAAHRENRIKPADEMPHSGTDGKPEKQGQVVATPQPQRDGQRQQQPPPLPPPPPAKTTARDAAVASPRPPPRNPPRDSFDRMITCTGNDSEHGSPQMHKKTGAPPANSREKQTPATTQQKQ